MSTMKTVISTDIHRHHIVQQSLNKHRFFNKILNPSWIEQSKNLMNLTNNPATARSTGTPWHQSAHPWIKEAQERLFQDFIDKRTFNGHSVDKLIENPALDPATTQQMRAEAARYAE